MSSITPHLRLYFPKLLRHLPYHASPNRTPFFSTTPLSLTFLYSPITFPRRSIPNKPSLFEPIRSQQRPQQVEETQHPAGAVDLTLLPQSLRDIVSLFQSVPDPKAKYQQLLHYGGRLPPLDPRYKTDEHRVRGCVSQVWVRAFPDPRDPAAVRFEADSDSVLTKGLAALLVLGLSGAPALVIAGVPPDFVHLLGLRQSLTPSRNNGFLNMLKLMQHKALQLYGQGGNSTEDSVLDEKDSVLDESTGNSSGSSVTIEVVGGEDVNLGLNGINRVGGGRVINGTDEETLEENLYAAGDRTSGSGGGRAERIREKLERELRPVELEVDDISYQHAGHAGVRGNSDGETHFNLRIVSEEFEGKSLVKRHRLVYDLLQEELQSGLHALSIVAKTPSEVSMK